MSGVGGGTRDKITRLQELLERVQMRAAARGGEHAHETHETHETHEGTAARTSPPPAMYDERGMSEAPPTPAYDAAYASVHPASEPSVPPEADEYEVEVSSEVVEVDIDIDEPMPLESGAQPVAQQTMPPDELIEEDQPMTREPSMRPPAESREEEVVHAAPPANEIEEPTPSSSRRPIAGEEASTEAYEAESSPRHTPPPESGKQVAAPSAHPPSRKPSAPPPSLEGHTLIGGWREPGLGTPQISPAAGMGTGVRVPAPPPSAPHAGYGARPSGTEPPATVVHGAGVAAQASGTRLTADVTQPELSSGANVASFTGAPAIDKPKTLGELLDLTLGL